MLAASTTEEEDDDLEVVQVKLKMESIVYLLFLSLAPLAHSAQVAVYPSSSSSSSLYSQSVEKTADLTRLINETLALNNKSLPNDLSSVQNQAAAPANLEEWTFERVEYDLMEFLQDLGARYQLKKEDQFVDQNLADKIIEARNDQTPTSAVSLTAHATNSKLTTAAVGAAAVADKTSTSTTTSTTTTTTTTADDGTSTPERPELSSFTASVASMEEISTSLASGDHDISESKWQYGIFDRFTRARASSSTARPTRDPYEDSLASLDVRQFNSDECGLRTYEGRLDDSLDGSSHLKADSLDGESANSEASKDLNQRRQRPGLSLWAHKKYQFQAVAADPVQGDDNQFPSVEKVEPQSSSQSVAITNWANKFEKDAYDSFKQQQQKIGASGAGDVPSLLDRVPNLGAQSAESEFNLASRRHWLQQQLGNTLQLLGFNGSAQSVAEFLNHTSGLSLNNRENMMKKSTNNKVAKSLEWPPKVDGGANLTPAISGSVASGVGLSARQDELKLEARVIGGSDARL